MNNFTGKNERKMNIYSTYWNISTKEAAFVEIIDWPEFRFRYRYRKSIFVPVSIPVPEEHFCSGSGRSIVEILQDS